MPDILEYLENPVISFVSVFGVLFGIGILIDWLWKFVLAVSIGFVVSNILLDLVIRGGKGIVQFTLLGNLTQEKGHGYLVYFFAILFSTLFGALLVDMLMGVLQSALPDIYLRTIAISFIVTSLVFWDFQQNFYE